jgi:membrane dipeptidase
MPYGPYDCVIVEGHRDSFELTRRRRLGEEKPLAKGLLPRFLHGGYDVVVFIVGGDCVTHRDMSDRPLEGSLDVLDFFINECQAAEGKAGIIKYKEDVPTEPLRGQVRFLLELEGGRPFQEDYTSGRKMREKMATLRAFYRLGVRSVQLTHNGRNELGDGMIDRRSKGGLSEFGLAVVKEMNRLHMLIGISHLSDTGELGGPRHRQPLQRPRHVRSSAQLYRRSVARSGQERRPHRHPFPDHDALQRAAAHPRRLCPAR